MATTNTDTNSNGNATPQGPGEQNMPEGVNLAEDEGHYIPIAIIAKPKMRGSEQDCQRIKHQDEYARYSDEIIRDLSAQAPEYNKMLARPSLRTLHGDVGVRMADKPQTVDEMRLFKEKLIMFPVTHFNA